MSLSEHCGGADFDFCNRQRSYISKKNESVQNVFILLELFMRLAFSLSFSLFFLLSVSVCFSVLLHPSACLKVYQRRCRVYSNLLFVCLALVLGCIYNLGKKCTDTLAVHWLIDQALTKTSYWNCLGVTWCFYLTVDSSFPYFKHSIQLFIL